jgi:hypothetical protein
VLKLAECDKIADAVRPRLAQVGAPASQEGLVITVGQRRTVTWPELVDVTQRAHSSLLIHARTLPRPVPVRVANARAGLRLIEEARCTANPAREV